MGGGQVTSGWSTACVYERRFRRYAAYKRAERAARAAARGAWELCGGPFHTPSREERGVGRDGCRRCDGGANPGGEPGNFFREIDVILDSCANAREVVRRWAAEIALDGGAR